MFNSDLATLSKTRTIHMTNDDKVEIIEILNLYAFALDTRQWDLFDRVFTQDVVAVFGPAGAGWNGLDIFKASFAEFHARLDSHQHTMMGHLVVVDGDTATGYSYAMRPRAARPGPVRAGTTTTWYAPSKVGASIAVSAASRAGPVTRTFPNSTTSTTPT